MSHMSSLFPVLFEHRRLLSDIRATGATSPDRALPRSALPPMSDSQFHRLLQQGDLREAASGRFYLFERQGVDPARFVKILILWLILFLVPILVIHLAP